MALGQEALTRSGRPRSQNSSSRHAKPPFATRVARSVPVLDSSDSQERTFDRARRLTFGLLVCLRLHLTSRAICAVGLQFVDWSADYRLCSRSPWNPHRLFDPIFDRLPVLLASPSAPLISALDDTLCQKTGRHIPGVGIARDPMSPAFHVNLCYGLRFVQVSVLVDRKSTRLNSSHLV